MCHTCAKEFWDSNFNLAVLDKISNFNEIALNSTYSHKSQFLKYICNFLDQLLHPFKFHGRGMSGILFFNFASCEPLMTQIACLYEVRNFKYQWIFYMNTVYRYIFNKSILSYLRGTNFFWPMYLNKEMFRYWVQRLIR